MKKERNRAVSPEHHIVRRAFSVKRCKENSSREKETSILLQKDSDSQSKKHSHPNQLSENRRKRDVCWGKRPEKEERLVKLVGDQNPSPKALPRSRKGQERKEQRKCHGNNGE